MPQPTLTYPLIAALTAVFLPFAGCLINALSGRKRTNSGIAIGTITGSLIAAAYVFTQVWGVAPLHIQWEWFVIGTRSFYVGLLLDNQSALMLLLVPLIAVPVHLYSVAYMKDDPGIHRYWMYLGLFCFAMMALVVADNLLLMYVCWELVGFASYLLIGFWFTKDTAAQASKKAFIVNRIGDLGFLIGMAILYAQFGTLDIRALFQGDGLVASANVVGTEWVTSVGSSMPSVWLTAAGIAFLLGAAAKSAQFPMHVWLPDAMAGPTAVSSLIHAATMVAAGVFLLARIFPLFNATTLAIMVVVGTSTAFVAAYFALAQYDIKKILAFSTISQLGFMVMGIGIGAYHVALFHLVTHAFFKCLLFLSAGAVIHEMQHLKEKNKLDIDPQDIRNMGGLRKHMPLTFVVMAVAGLALAGLPPTAGYLSKDALLVHAFEWAAVQRGVAGVVPYLLLAASGFTAFYIARLVFKVFVAPSAMATTAAAHEANKWMLMPMIFLAACSLFPLFSIHPFDVGHVWVIQGMLPLALWPAASLYHTLVPVFATLLSLSMFAIAWRWYAKGTYPLRGRGLLYRLSFHQGYVDRFYHVALVDPLLRLSRFFVTIDRLVVDGVVDGCGRIGRLFAGLAAWFDHYVVDGLVRFVGKMAFWLGNVLRRTQTGRVQYYLFTMFFIVLMVLIYQMIIQA